MYLEPAEAGIVADNSRRIRAAPFHGAYTAHQMVEHDDVNVCCPGARVIGPEPATKIGAIEKEGT